VILVGVEPVASGRVGKTGPSACRFRSGRGGVAGSGAQAVADAIECGVDGFLFVTVRCGTAAPRPGRPVGWPEPVGFSASRASKARVRSPRAAMAASGPRMSIGPSTRSSSGGGAGQARGSERLGGAGCRAAVPVAPGRWRMVRVFGRAVRRLGFGVVVSGLGGGWRKR